MSGKFTIRCRLKYHLTVAYILPDKSNPQFYTCILGENVDTKTVGTKIISQTKYIFDTKGLLISNSGAKHVTYRTYRYGKFEIRIRK